MRQRFVLPNGDWIDLTQRLNHAQRRRIRAASGTPEVTTEGVAAMALDWSVRDDDGVAIPFPGAAVDGIPSEALDRFPIDSFDAIAEKAVEIVMGSPDPKGTDSLSNGSRRGHASPSSRISQTPTS